MILSNPPILLNLTTVYVGGPSSVASVCYDAKLRQNSATFQMLLNISAAKILMKSSRYRYHRYLKRVRMLVEFLSYSEFAALKNSKLCIYRLFRITSTHYFFYQTKCLSDYPCFVEFIE